MIIMFLYCAPCAALRPFNHSARWASPQPKCVRKLNGKFTTFPSANPIPDVPDNARLLRASCMVCGKRAPFVVTEEHWRECHYQVDDLCECGIPVTHEGPCLPALLELHNG